jgi:hypothetical protein
MADAGTKYSFCLSSGFVLTDEGPILGTQLACLLSAEPALRRSFANPGSPPVEVRVRC